MSTLALAPPWYRDLGGEPTLDELIAGVWEGLAAHHPVDCPICGRQFVALYGAGARGGPGSEAGPGAGRVFEGGRCRGCATTLS